MADESEVLRTYPVVMYRRSPGPPGWMFRNADETDWHGPFGSRDEAVSFGLEAMTMNQNGTTVLAKTSVRRAA